MTPVRQLSASAPVLALNTEPAAVRLPAGTEWATPLGPRSVSVQPTMALAAPAQSGVQARSAQLAPTEVVGAQAVFAQALVDNARRTFALGSTRQFSPGETAPSDLGAQVAI